MCTCVANLHSSASFPTSTDTILGVSNDAVGLLWSTTIWRFKQLRCMDRPRESLKHLFTLACCEGRGAGRRSLLGQENSVGLLIGTGGGKYTWGLSV